MMERRVRAAIRAEPMGTVQEILVKDCA
jgi:hypothetical protein